MLFFSKIKLSLKEIGVTTKNWKKSLLDGFIFTSIGWVILLVLVSRINPNPSGINLTKGLSEIISWSYLVHSYLQELVRATMQISIKGFFENCNNIYAVGLTAMLFASAHSYFGIEAVLATLIANIIFGFIYTRSYNLIGVSLVHFFLGWMAFNSGLMT